MSYQYNLICMNLQHFPIVHASENDSNGFVIILARHLSMIGDWNVRYHHFPVYCAWGCRYHSDVSVVSVGVNTIRELHIIFRCVRVCVWVCACVLFKKVYAPSSCFQKSLLPVVSGHWKKYLPRDFLVEKKDAPRDFLNQEKSPPRDLRCSEKYLPRCFLTGPVSDKFCQLPKCCEKGKNCTKNGTYLNLDLH